jgi:hypothetical protein
MNDVEHQFQTFYLNNSGSKWVQVNRLGKKPKVKVLFPDGTIKERTCLFYESFGNFALTCIYYKGKVHKFFQDSCLIKDKDGNEVLFEGIILKSTDI